jgi:hypothetical protein
MKVFWVLGAVVLVATGGVFWWYRSNGEWRTVAGRLDAQVAQARRHGIPFQASDLAPTSVVSEEDNGATAILIATDAAKRIDDPSMDWRAVAVSMFQDPLPVKQIEAQLAPYAKVTELARNAAKYPSCDFHRNYDFGSRLDVADLTNDRLLVRLLCFSAELAATRGDITNCVSDLRSARRITMLMAADHTAGSLMGATSAELLLLRYVSVCLNKLDHNAAGLEAIRSFMREDAPLPDLRQALRAEAYFGLNMARNYDEPAKDRNGDVMPPSGVPDLAKLQLSGLPQTLKRQAYLVRYLEVWNKIFDVLDRGGRGLEVSKAMDDGMEAASSSTDPTLAVNRLVLPSLYDTVTSVDLVRTQRILVADLAMALQYRLKTGKMPVTLAEAGVQDLDPFDGKPIRIVKMDKEWRIYSVGEDAFDDKGKTAYEVTNATDRIGPPGDEVVIYPATNRPSGRRSK